MTIMVWATGHAIDPGTDQGGFSISRRSADHCQAAVQALVQTFQEARPEDQIARDPGPVQLGLKQDLLLIVQFDRLHKTFYSIFTRFTLAGGIEKFKQLLKAMNFRTRFV
jgi:hypothetical protein